MIIKRFSIGCLSCDDFEAAKRYFGEVVTEEEIEESDRILVEQDFIEYLDNQLKDMAEDEEAEDG